MKRRWWFLLWIAAIALMLWFHTTRGQLLLRRDAAGAALRAAQAADAADDFHVAADQYRAALTELPAEAPQRAAITFAMQRAESRGRPVLDRIDTWDKHLKAAVAANEPAAVQNDIRSELAALHFEAAFAMKRTGAPAALWRDQSELARQQFHYIATTDGDPSRAEAAATNVETVCRLEHMDRTVLESRPLPEDEQKLPDAYQRVKEKASQPGDQGEDGGSSGPPKKPDPKPDPWNHPPERKGS